MVKIGLKTDPINTRYSMNWLFDLLNEEGIEYVQLGSFFELYSLEDDYFHRLKEEADKRKIRIKSLFTAHRELGGFFSGDRYMERAARKNYERFIAVASVLGVDYCGSNPGSVYRDQMQLKAAGIECYLSHMKELMHLAYEKGLKGLTMEPMSCLAEPPTLPDEIHYMAGSLEAYHRANLSTAPVYLCADTSHGYVNATYQQVHSSFELFAACIPYMAEFHFKNTDTYYHSTFGFSAQERKKGAIYLQEFRQLCQAHAACFPVDEVVGYLEISGPKTGRDYTDGKLAGMLRESLRALRADFENEFILLQ